jgi:hypothetical protein
MIQVGAPATFTIEPFKIFSILAPENTHLAPDSKI